MAKSARIANVVLIAGFGLSVLLLLVGMVVWPDRSRLPHEGRVHFPRHLDWDFPDRFQSVFETRLGLRADLISGYNTLAYLAFSAAASPGVVVGRERWLFLDQDRMRESIAGGDPFTPEELDAWMTALTACERHIGAWGGRLLVVVAPNKASIYPDKLPSSRSLGAQRRIDQFFARLSRADIAHLDLRGPVAALRRSGKPPFGKLDTHWNGHAALEAAQAIVQAVTKLTTKPMSFAGERVHTGIEEQHGDLARMMGLLESVREGRPVAFMDGSETSRELSRRFTVPELPRQEVQAQIFAGLDPGAPRVVVHRDSFSRVLVPLLVDSFSRSVWLWRREFDRATIDRERPDVVILQLAERYLEGPPQQNPF